MKRAGIAERPAWIEIAVVSYIALAILLKLLYSARVVTAGATESIVVRTALATTLCLIAPFIVLPRAFRLPLLLVIDVFVSVALLADELYFRRYLDLIAPDDLVSAPIIFKGFARAVVIDALRPGDLWYVADVAALIVAIPFIRAAQRGRPAIPLRRRALTAAAALAVAAIAAAPLIRLIADRRLAATAADRLRAPATIGPLPYQLFEGARRLAAAPEPLPDFDAVRAFLAARASDARPSSLFGAARGRNLILIQAESLQGFPVGLVLDGRPVTPNLDAFAAESLQFTNFFDQTHHGFTSDGEFTTLASLHPAADGSASLRFFGNHYRSLAALLADRGYDTLSACGDVGTTWSMAMMHPNHGFELSLFADRFEWNHRVALMPDAEFFVDMMPRLSERKRPFFAFLISSTNHGPPFETPDRSSMPLPDRLRGRTIGDYLQTVHYFDRAFGELMQALRRAGLLDETVVAVYGDHQAYLEMTRELVPLRGLDSDKRRDRWLIDRRIPFLVRLPGGAHAAQRDEPAGHLDIAPTLLGLLGVDDPDRVMFGRDATSATPPFVVFRNGGFADADHIYAQPDVVNEPPACFEVRSERPVACEPLEPIRERAGRQLAMSDSVLQNDFIQRLVRAPIPRTLRDLAPPRSFSPQFNAAHVAVTWFDLSAPAPSGATFSIDNGGTAIQVMFSPSIDPAARPNETEGAIFEVWGQGARLYERRVLPTDLLAERVDVPPPGDGRSTTEISFVTRSPSGRSLHATWQRVRFAKISTADHHSVSGTPAR